LTRQFLERRGEAFEGRTARNGESGLDAAWVSLVEIVRRIEQHPYHWPIGRTIFQKIAFVATSEGLPTRLNYRRGSFGPFSQELKSVEAKLINNGLLQEERQGKMFMVKVGPNFDRIRQRYTPAFDQWATIVEKTSDLFTRVDTNQAEVIATVLFAAQELDRAQDAQLSEKDVLQSVMQWKQKRRPPLDEVTVASTIRNLGMLRWLDVKASPDLRLPEEETLAA
jgi:hypothetical protein